MDDQRFDDLARRLAGTSSRRQLLRGLVAGAAGMLAGTLGQSGLGAQASNCDICHGLPPGKERGTCRSSCARSGGFPAGCTSTAQLCRSASGDYTCCVGSETCVNGTCEGCSPTPCQPGQCGPVPDGCGNTVECGTCSGAGESCVEGECVCQPPDCSHLECGEIISPCGTCTKACPSGEMCVDGACDVAEGSVPTGGACDEDADCASGVCCGQMCCGAGQMCEGTAESGTCDVAGGSVSTGGACDENADCASGVCCGQVCCSGGQACEGDTQVGTCDAVCTACGPRGICLCACTGDGCDPGQPVCIDDCCVCL